MINDLGADAQRGHTNERRRLSHRLGYRALIVLPLFREGALIGLFTLLSKEANVFTGDEVKLLTEMAGDISFAGLPGQSAAAGLPGVLRCADRLAEPHLV
ncbi:MAG: GAF domain-containing protein [Gammaproteobacteria bacterium]